jgi:hypothetical protein
MNGYSTMCMALDFAPETFPQLASLEDYPTRRGPQQYEIAEWMEEHFQPDRLKMWHLGEYENSPGSMCHFGLILLQDNSGEMSSWRRLGICTRLADEQIEPAAYSLEDFAKVGCQPAHSSENMLSRSQQLRSFKVDDENPHCEDLNATSGE